MSTLQATQTGYVPSAHSRLQDGVDSESGQPGDRVAGLYRGATPGVPAVREPGVERMPRSGSGLVDPTLCVLSAPQFQRALERERSLADRGTRRFSLLALRRPPGARTEGRVRDALPELAEQVCERLRSTDLVGRVDPDRVDILLTDTEPAGAQVVAVWVEQVEATLGLDLERKIYVYPSVSEPNTGRGKDDESHWGGPHVGVHSNGNGSSRPTKRREGEGIPIVAAAAKNGAAKNGAATNGMATNRTGAHGHLNGHALGTTHEALPRSEVVLRESRWPMVDLWPHLGAPTPRWKRSLDILLSAFALLVLSPLFALIAIAIRLDSPGPAIFRQLRAGRGARPFVFYKFRSMIVGAEEQRAALAGQNEKDGPIFKIRQDPRITPLGRLLRRWSLDELPQLWNVLKGDISLVGPRSPTLDEVGEYERWQRRRLCVTGGITCFWQVSGRSQISFRDWMRLDMRYVACRNLWLDLRLLVLTLPAVLSGRGAC